MVDGSQGFLLLSLPRATLTTPTFTYTDALYLECVTIPPYKSPFADRDVYLLLRISTYEVAIDPARSISSSIQPNAHLYTFHATDSEAQFELSIPDPHKDVCLAQDLETFNHILTQYAQFQTEQADPSWPADVHMDTKEKPVDDINEYEDLRGRLVLINESDGKVVGELDNQFHIREDPALTNGLNESDPVFLELPPDYDSVVRSDGMYVQGQAGELTYKEAFVRVVSREERDAITTTASLVSHAISATTTLLLSGVSYASQYYIKHSKPSPKVAVVSYSSTSANPYTGFSSHSRSGPSAHRAVVISHPRTRTALTHAHAVSGKAVQISGKTVQLVENLVRKAVGGKGKSKVKRPNPLAASQYPDYNSYSAYTDEKPVMPSEKDTYAYSGHQPTSKPPFTGYEPVQQNPQPLVIRPSLRKRDKIILSADLILGTMEESAKRILDVGSHEINRAVAHKRGQEAGENSALATGAARNVALVYVDLRGIGRRAILRTAGKEVVKTALSSGDSIRLRDVSGNVQYQQQNPYAQYPGPSTHPQYPGSHSIPPPPPRRHPDEKRN